MCEGRFAQSGRTVKEHMIQCFLAFPGRLNKYVDILPDFVLSDHLSQPTGA
jgi:hypothetical protein